MIMIPPAERKHLTKQRPQSGNTPDDKSDAIFGIAPNHDVCDTVEIIVGVVEIDGIFESDASGEGCENSEREEEADGEFGVEVQLEGVEEGEGTRKKKKN